MTATILKRNAVAAAGLLAAGYVPLVLSGTQLASLTTVVAFAIALLSLNLLLGYAGQISLGQASFVGTGAFLTLQLAGRGWPPVLAIPVAAFGVAAIAALVGLPSLRIKGLAVAIATLVYGIAAEKFLFNQGWFSGSDAGLFLDAPFEHRDLYNTYLLALGFVLVIVLLDRQIRDSKLGRAFIVTRHGEERAVAFGVEPGTSKLQAYAASGYIAGIAGGLLVVLSGLVSGPDFGFLASLEYLAYAVLGGIGSRIGVILAAVLLVGVPEFFPPPDPRLAPLVGGILLIVVILFLPDGFGGVARRVGKWWRAQTFRLRLSAVGFGLLVAAMLVVVHHGIRTSTTETTSTDVDGETVENVTERIPDYEGDGILALSLGTLVLLGGAYALFGPRGQTTSTDDDTDLAAGDGGGPPADAAEDPVAKARQAAHNAAIVRNVDRPLTLRMPTRVMFEATNVGVRFGGVQALKDISLEVRQGEIVGLIGANGAGKSTFYNVVSGFVTPESGSSLKYKGRELLDAPASVRTTWGVARTFQHMGLVRAQSVQDNVLLAQHWLAHYDEWLGSMKLGGAVRTEAELRHRAQLALEIFGLEGHLHDELGSLSYGTMRMVELASAVASGADLLFFDEASAGLAPTEAHALADRFLALRDELDLTLVVIEHHVPLIARVCDYVYCLASGRQLAEGEPASVQSNPEVVAEFLGRSTINKDGDEASDAPPPASGTAATATKKAVKKTARTRASKSTKKTAKKTTKKTARKSAKKTTGKGGAS